MNKNIKTFCIRFLFVFLPLLAIIASGASLYLWYKVLTPEAERISLKPPSQISPYAFSAGLDENLRNVLKEFKIGDEAIKSRKADTFQDQINMIYTVSVPENVSLTLLNLRITVMTRETGGRVINGVEGSKGQTLTLTVGVGKNSTDIIILRKVRGIVTRIVKVAVIVDDLGIKDPELAKRLCNLEQVLTLAILPFQRHTTRIVDLARQTDTPYILHMPMEPSSDKVDPGEGAIFIRDDENTVRKKIERAFRSVKGAEGLNNHMGSKTTEDVRSMERVMKFLHDNNYFFIDSQTSRESKGYSISQNLGVRSTMISGYIDVTDEKASIEKRLNELSDLALEKGSAIILCHDRPNTVDVLEMMLPQLQEKGITFVKVSDLIH